MNEPLARLSAARGIETRYVGFDGIPRTVPTATLEALVDALGSPAEADRPAPTIAEVRAEPAPRRCYVPSDLAGARVWGITCQVASLTSARNHGMGDFADLAELCGVAAAEGADFVGLGPLHALFWSAPARVCPFSPSNRLFLNPLYIALDWVAGFDRLTAEEEAQAARARATRLVDAVAVARLKDRVLARVFAAFAWTDAERADFKAFGEAGGAALAAHVLFEAISAAMTADGHGPVPGDWPAAFRDPQSVQVAAFAAANQAAVDYHLWLQWLARRQLERVQRAARESGMRVGLYLDCAVGTAADGSAVWRDPALALPSFSIGAPPDFFNLKGQDWGLAPLSPLVLAQRDGRPLAAILAAVMGGGGAMRLDHAMGLARLWLIPHGGRERDGAYVRYPLSRLLARLAEVSQATGALVVGEDLGVVPQGFRALMAERAVHGHRADLLELKDGKFADPRRWPVDALACFSTHDLPTFAGWWGGVDLDLRQSLGLLVGEAADAARAQRSRDRDALQARLGGADDVVGKSTRLHAHIAQSPCRLAALQIEDALGLTNQVNLPGTVEEYPNWRQRLPVAVEGLRDEASFAAHTAAMRSIRPR